MIFEPPQDLPGIGENPAGATVRLLLCNACLMERIRPVVGAAPELAKGTPASGARKVTPLSPGDRVVIVGAGPAGLTAAYQLAKLRIEGSISEADVIRLLTEDHGMNRGSANDYVDGLRHLLAGELYTRTINAAATRHYLQNIRNDFGLATARVALSSIRKHIEYYEKVSDARCVTLRQIVAEFEADLAHPG